MRKFFFVVALFSLCFNVIISQESKPPSDSVSYIPFERIIRTLEQKYQVTFFFDSERLQNRKINIGVSELPFDEALDRIEKLTGYSSLKMNNNCYVLLPFESAQQQTYQEYIPIGNPLDFGRYSNADVEGEVLDGKDGEPLVGAVISHDKLKLAVNTDKNGKFIMKLPVGDHELSVKFYGYEESSAKIKVYGKGSLVLELYEQSISLDEVIVRAEMAQNSVMRNQMSMVRIDARAIKELPVSMGETDIIRSVTLMPGVQSVGEFGTGFNVRGGSADQNLILMEDLPVFNPSHVFGLISIVNPDDVSGVTLLKAGIPAKYGERASSVMDIKMGGTQTDKFYAKGGIGLISSRLNLKVPLFNKKVVFSLGGRSSYSDWILKRLPDVDLKNSSAGFYDLNAMLSISPNSSNRISLFGYMSDDNFKFSSTTGYQYGNLMGGAKWTHVFNSNLSMTAMAGRSQYSLNIEEDVDKPFDMSKIATGVVYDCFKWNFSWAMFRKNSIDIGINAIRYNNSPGELKPGSAESAVMPKKLNNEQAYELSAYLSDNLSVTDKLNIEAGVRFTEYLLTGPYQSRIYDPQKPRLSDNLIEVKDYTGSEVVYNHQGIEPRFSVIYKLNTESSLKGSYSRIHQYLNLISNTSVIAPTDVWKLSDQNISPLICNQVAVGYYRNFIKKALEASVEVYFKQLSNVIEYKDGAKLLMNEVLETDLIPAKGYNYGIEFYVKKISGRLTGWASYTYSKSIRQTNSVFEEEKIKNNQIFLSNYDKPHNLITVANYHISRRWRFSSTFIYNSGRPVTLTEMKYFFQGNQLVYYSEINKYRLPDYHMLDVSITLDESLRLKKKWKGSWTFSVVNLYSRKNAYSAFYQKEVPNIRNDYRTFSLYKLYIIGRPLPTLTYNFTF
jgi:hypothetical protein